MSRNSDERGARNSRWKDFQGSDLTLTIAISQAPAREVLRLQVQEMFDNEKLVCSINSKFSVLAVT